MSIQSGNSVIAVLHSPREKLLGILDNIGAEGISIRGIELGYFDDLCRAVTSGDSYLPLTDQFVPMWRVERVTLDEATGEIPSMADTFFQRTGKELTEI